MGAIVNVEKLACECVAGAIGEIVNIQHLEPIGFWHFAHSYVSQQSACFCCSKLYGEWLVNIQVRGKWRRADEGTFMLMAKCCHDVDLIRYLMGQSCNRISSMGSLQVFRPVRLCVQTRVAAGAAVGTTGATSHKPRSRAIHLILQRSPAAVILYCLCMLGVPCLQQDRKPPKASDRCVTCEVEGDCPYSAKKIYLERAKYGLYGWPVGVIVDGGMYGLAPRLPVRTGS